jgi:hypothetical protein
MKRVSRILLLALSLAVGCTAAGFAANGGLPEDRDERALPATRGTQAAGLAAQVREIANSTMISRAKKEKRISIAVRVAVVAATSYKQNPDEVLGIGMALAAAAAQAAPPFTDVIANAVSFAPAIARIDGASSQVRTAAFAAARAPRGRRIRQTPAAEYAAAVPAPEEEESRTPAPRIRSRPAAAPEAPRETEAMAARTDETVSPDLAAAADSAVTYRPPPATTANGGIILTANLSARHDDNVFWSQTNKVSDTVVSLAPGAEYRFGQNSLAHGGIRYEEAFTRYTGKSVPNANLGSGSADFGYADEKLNVVGTAAFNQLYQNNTDLLAQGGRTLLRSDTLALGAAVESQFTAKLSAKLGGNYQRTEYKTAGLVTSRNLEWPFSLYFHALPKLDFLTGFTYGTERPEGGGPTGKDLYYNVGLRGSLTPKLTGEFSVGDRIREVGTNPRERLLGFDGSFNYEVTPKTNGVLALSRGFSVSALGESLTNGSYRLGFTTEMTPQWQMGTYVTYRSVEYGSAVFTLANSSAVNRRKDNYWEGNLEATYNYSLWLNASAYYTLRNNRSTVPGVEFSNNIVGLILGLRY